MTWRVRRGRAVVADEERAVGTQPERHQLRRQLHAAALKGLGQRVVGREARHQRDLDAEARQIRQLEVEEGQLAPVEDGRKSLDLRAEPGRHAPREHDCRHLAAPDDLAAECGLALAFGRARRGQRMCHVLGRYFDRLGDARQDLEIVAGRDQPRLQLLEGHAIEVEALEQRGQVRRDLMARDPHHGPP